MQGFEGFLVVYGCFLAKEGLDEGVEFGVLLATEYRGTGLRFFLERRFRVGFLELSIETGTIVLQPEAEFGYDLIDLYYILCI